MVFFFICDDLSCFDGFISISMLFCTSWNDGNFNGKVMLKLLHLEKLQFLVILYMLDHL